MHFNQGVIEKDLPCLYKESEKIISISKTAINIYDSFIEYLKVYL